MGPLKGVRVLDLSRMLPVGVLSQLLADLGADVVKVERPGVGEEGRGFGAPVAGTSATHAFLDRGKKSVALDLKHPHGLAVVHSLVAQADVVLESFRPGVAERLGVGYDDLRALNPNLVYCSVNGYGTGGPRDQEPGHDMNYLSYAGAMHFGGTKAHGPQPGGIQVADLLGGLTGGIGLLAALLAVRSGAPGTRVEVALADAALWALGLHVSSWMAGGDAAGPESTAVTGAGPAYRVYRCADGRYLSVAAIEPQFWAQFVTAVERPDLIARQHDPSAIEEVAALVATQELAHWTKLLDGLETCVSPVQDFSEVAADEQFQARGMFVPVPGQDEVLQVGNPIKLSDPLPTPSPASALVGGDTEAVLAGLDLPPEVRRSALAWATTTNDRGEESR
ncbi:CaiB/BaiF CoA transferase family protein [Nocardioides houyundeii]|uniref:CaiB/BaiF CoA transferase family protein n=1 Tax=Nocardioides houyundeii TaxID=2045452 RepID=UPI000DF1F620|nr:CaiB/BaiF CoA-transferase family protein [Nocardioides houyundeii]